MKKTRFGALRALALAVLAAVVTTTANFGFAQENSDVLQVRDIVYKKVGDREIKLNLFLPTNEKGETIKGLPLAIWLDSGCWYSGEPGDGGLWRQTDALKRGFAVASVSHRPINEAPFPAPMEDVRAAVRFLRKHASDYGYDPNRFVVSGASSGGHLSLTLGISDEKTPFNVGDNLDVSGEVQCVVDFFGPADLEVVFERFGDECIDCIFIANGVSRDALKKDHPDHAKLMANAKKYSPINYVDEKFAPTIILQGNDDNIVPLSQSALMYETLKVAKVRSQFIVSDGGVHDPWSLGSKIFLTREIYEFIKW